MNVTIKVNKLKDPKGAALGIATINFGGEFKANNISIMKNEEKGTLGVVYPSLKVEKTDEKGEKTTDYNPFFMPIKQNPEHKEFPTELKDKILAAFADGKAKSIQINTDRPVVTASMRPISNEQYPQSKAVGSIYINNMFVINNVYVNEGKNGLYVKMPAYKSNEIDENGNNKYKDYCYGVTDGMRAEITGACIDAYNKALDKAVEAPTKESLIDTLSAKTMEANSKAASEQSISAPQKENSQQIG